MSSLNTVSHRPLPPLLSALQQQFANGTNAAGAASSPWNNVPASSSVSSSSSTSTSSATTGSSSNNGVTGSSSPALGSNALSGLLSAQEQQSTANAAQTLSDGIDADNDGDGQTSASAVQGTNGRQHRHHHHGGGVDPMAALLDGTSDGATRHVTLNGDGSTTTTRTFADGTTMTTTSGSSAGTPAAPAGTSLSGPTGQNQQDMGQMLAALSRIQSATMPSPASSVAA